MMIMIMMMMMMIMIMMMMMMMEGSNSRPPRQGELVGGLFCAPYSAQLISRQLIAHRLPSSSNDNNIGDHLVDMRIIVACVCLLRELCC